MHVAACVVLYWALVRPVNMKAVHGAEPWVARKHLKEQQPMEGSAHRLPGRREGLQVGLAAPRPFLPGQAC